MSGATAPSHYLRQCGLAPIICSISSQWIKGVPHWSGSQSSVQSDAPPAATTNGSWYFILFYKQSMEYVIQYQNIARKWYVEPMSQSYVRPANPVGSKTLFKFGTDPMNILNYRFKW